MMFLPLLLPICNHWLLYRAFGVCTEKSDHCKCMLLSKCDQGSLKELRHINDVFPEEMTEILKREGFAEFISTKPEDCQRSRCDDVGRKCPGKSTCRSQRRCFSDQCVCAISIQCLDENLLPKPIRTSKSHDLKRVARLIKDGHEKVTVTLSMQGNFPCSEKTVCPKLMKYCQSPKHLRSCSARPTCDEKNPMCIVEASCSKSASDILEKDFVPPANATIIKVKNSEECLKKICQKLAKSAPNCRDAKYCSLSGPCPSKAGDHCRCQVHNSCLSQDVLGEEKPRLNESHLILANPPPKGMEEGFEIVNVEATTAQGKDEEGDYDNLADLLGRKPFNKAKIEARKGKDGLQKESQPKVPATDQKVSIPAKAGKMPAKAPKEPVPLTKPGKTSVESRQVSIPTKPGKAPARARKGSDKTPVRAGLSPVNLAEQLKNGGNVSVEIARMEDCDEQVCSDLRDVCQQVGTCWTEVRCMGSGPSNCRCLVSVECHMQVNFISALFAM
jgi:hypothetical protein